MKANINVKKLATEIANLKVHEFYRRLSFLASDKNYEDSVVETLYLTEDGTGKKAMNEEAKEIFNKNYESYFSLILTCEEND